MVPFPNFETGTVVPPFLVRVSVFLKIRCLVKIEQSVRNTEADSN